jgi:hypothetical protein
LQESDILLVKILENRVSNKKVIVMILHRSHFGVFGNFWVARKKVLFSNHIAFERREERIETGSHYVAQAAPELFILLPLTPEHWDCRSGLLHLDNLRDY